MANKPLPVQVPSGHGVGRYFAVPAQLKIAASFGRSSECTIDSLHAPARGLAGGMLPCEVCISLLLNLEQVCVDAQGR